MTVLVRFVPIVAVIAMDGFVISALIPVCLVLPTASGELGHAFLSETWPPA